MPASPEKQELLLEILYLLSRIMDLDEGNNLEHGLQVAEISRAIARQLNHSAPDQLFVAGLLHDIGGIDLDNHILHYALSDFQDIKSREHSTRGADILQNFQPFHALAGWIADHHERYDGTGFPEGKSKHGITTEGAILHLADLVDIFARTHPQASLKEIRRFLNKQSSSSTAPVIVEAAKRFFSTPESLLLIRGTDCRNDYCPSLATILPGISSLSLPELISQLLWLTAQVADCKGSARTFHSNRTAFYCYRIAKEFDHPDLAPLQALWAGLLHDIGMRSVPSKELQGRRSSLPTQSSLYRAHPLVSADLVSKVHELAHLSPILAAHHEYRDGSGFPKGLQGDEIPLLSQILCISDQYDRLAGMMEQGIRTGHHQALNTLEKGRGKLFSSDLLDKALPVFQFWGPRDISWIRDVKNVHAFFTSDPFDNIFQERQEKQKGSEKTDGSFSPRQWAFARLTPDFSFLEGKEALCALIECDDIDIFFDVFEEDTVQKAREMLALLQDETSVTLSLTSRRGRPLELIFIKQQHGYDLLYRGINENPLFTRKHSLFFQHFRNTPEAELLFDEKNIIRAVNKSAISLLEFPEEELVGKTIEALFSPFLSKVKLTALHTFLESTDENTWSEEFPLANGEGRYCILQVSIERLIGIDGGQPTFLCRLLDISVRKRIEQDLFIRDRALQLIVHDLSGMTGELFFKSLLQQFVILVRSRIVMVGELINGDKSIRVISYMELGNFIEKRDFFLQDTPCKMIIKRGEIVFPRRLQEFFPSEKMLLQQGIQSYWGLPLRRQDGTIIGVLVAMNEKEIHRSENTRAIVRILQSLAGSELSRMQTARILKENEKLLESQNRELTRMNQLKSDMIAVTSHDLKSPLSAIIGYASLLEQYYATMEEEKKVYYIKRIEEEGQKQLSFINKLLDLYRIESGSIDLELTPERPDLLLNDCIMTHKQVASARNISIELHIQGEPVHILLDRLRMDQVFSNLLSNAVKFSPANKIISVYYRQEPSTISIKVCDRGKGIDEKEIVNIFDRYYMGRTNFDIRPEGSGLGLYIVKNIISLHGGKVFAQNRKEGGSCFTIVIPIKTMD